MARFLQRLLASKFAARPSSGEEAQSVELQHDLEVAQTRIAELEDEERSMFLAEMGMEEPGLDRVIRAGYSLLGLQTYFTTGEKETRAWTIHIGDTAPKAAGVIHGDFERGFIKAETVSYADLTACGSIAAAREKGVYRMEGKEYVVQEGDVMLFKFNV